MVRFIEFMISEKRSTTNRYISMFFCVHYSVLINVLYLRGLINSEKMCLYVIFICVLTITFYEEWKKVKVCLLYRIYTDNF